MTYAELHRRSDALASHCDRLGLAPGGAIGLLLTPSVDAVVAALGVLKTGNAYVPLDPSVPRERLERMVEDAAVEWVITTPAHADRLPRGRARPLLLDRPHDICGQRRQTRVAADALAYIIFTSGSTGRPKGVMVPHRAVVNYLAWCLRTYPTGDGCGVPLCSPLASDMSVTSLFLPLISGSRIVILDADDPVESLDSALRGPSRFSFVKLTPSHLEALRHLSLGSDPPRNTHAFVVGGEALHGDGLALWRQHAPDVMVFNEYGPTETVVGCAVHALRAGEIGDGPVPIGRPIANTRFYVLDRHGEPVPIGVAGELVIGGAGVARGYVNDPGLTAERFVPDPFSPEPDARMYRSGDLVRYRGDGILEFLGRIDRQLKIRGYRVEPGDVEAAIRRSPEVADVVVAARDPGTSDRELVAYVVLRTAAADPDTAALRRQTIRDLVRQQLPPYMVPGAVRFVNAIPLTPSGKTDLARLEAAASGDIAPVRVSAPPATPLECVIASTFQHVLQRESVGVGDDFFAHLGGHSLLATKVVARLRELLRVELPLRQLFETPTVEGLARALTDNGRFGAQVVRTAEVLLAVLSMTDAQVTEELSASSPDPALSSSSRTAGADTAGA